MGCKNIRFVMLALTFVMQNLVSTVDLLFPYYAVCVNDDHPNALPFTVSRMSVLLIIGCMATLLSSFASIYLNRIFGIKKTYLAYTLVGLLTALCCGISSTFIFWQFAICLALISTSVGNCQAQFYSFTNFWAPQQDVGIFMGVAMTIFDLPSLIGSQYYGLLCEPLGWRNFYYIIGGIDLIFFLLFLIFYTNNPADNAFVSPEELKYILDGQISEHQDKEKNEHMLHKKSYIISDIRTLFSNHFVLVSAVFGSPIYVMYLFIAILTPIYIKGIYHTSDFVTGNLCGIGYGVCLIVKLVAPVVDKYVKLNEQTKFYLYGTICTVSGTTALVLLGLAQNDSIWMIYVGLFFYGLTGFGALSFNKAIVSMTKQFSGLYGNICQVFLDVSGIVVSLLIMFFVNPNDVPSLRVVWFAIAAYTLFGYTAQLLTYKLKPRPFTISHSKE